MTRKRRQEEEEVKISMTPMIDVVFLLLIFFMVTMKFRTLEGRIEARLPKDLGQQNTAPKERDKDPVRVRVKLLDAKPRRLMTMVHQYRSAADVFGDQVALGDSMFRIQFQVGNQPVLELVQRTVMSGKQPVTTMKWYANGREVDGPEPLHRHVLRAHRAMPEVPAIIDPDRAAPYAALVTALDSCKRARFEQIRFAGKIGP